MKISVTQDDIDKGIRLLSDSCPVAIAMNRCGFVRSAAYKTYLIWNHRGTFSGWNGMATPLLVKEFITKFDEGQAVSPFEFDLDERETNV